LSEMSDEDNFFLSGHFTDEGATRLNDFLFSLARPKEFPEMNRLRNDDLFFEVLTDWLTKYADKIRFYKPVVFNKNTPLSVPTGIATI